MRRLSNAAALAGLLAALAVTPARAQPSPVSQDLPIITMFKGGHSGFATPRTAVITSMADLRAYFANSAVDLGVQPRVDFTTEDVLVAALGTRPTGGYGVEVTKVTLMTGGFTGGHAFVEVTETSPAPGTIVTMALTSPIHVVRVPKGAIAYHFNTVRPSTGFETLDLAIEDPFRQTSERLVLEASGAATVYRSSPTARYMPVAGQATPAQLRAVQDAFRAADVGTLPGDIPDPRLFIVAPPRLTLTSTLPGGATHATSANVGYYTPYEARLAPLVDALRAVTAGLIAAPAALERLHLVWSGGLAPWSQELTIEQDGTTVFARTGYAGNPSRFWSGQATAAELQALVDAVAAADLPSLPATIDDPTPVMDVPSLHLVATLGGADTTIHVTKAGFYDTYEARLAPVVDAARAVADRLSQGGTLTLEGLVARAAGRLTLGGTEVRPGEPTTPVLSALVGQRVRATGRLYTYGGRQRLDIASLAGETRANLNLRTRPTTAATVVRTLPRGTAVEVLDVSASGLWLLVRAGQDTGWVYRSYVRVAR